LSGHLGNAWRMIRGKKSHLVELHFDSEFADTIADTHWHSTQEVIWNGDDSITFRCKVDGLDEIVWWILSMGPHCVVKKPRELIEQVKSLAHAMVVQYASE
jgi:predicted DNA-binding transcriptional regulator YafY